MRKEEEGREGEGKKGGVGERSRRREEGGGAGGGRKEEEQEGGGGGGRMRDRETRESESREWRVESDKQTDRHTERDRT